MSHYKSNYHGKISLSFEPPYAIRTPDLQLTGVDDWSSE